MQSNGFTKKYIYSIIIFLSLFISYTFNIGGVADERFYDLDKFDEGMVTGRLEVVEKDGLFSHGCFPGFYIEYPEDYKIGDNINQTQQYADFIINKPTNGTFIPYKTQPGGQVFVYSLIQITLPCDNLTKMKIYRGINALLSALVFTILLGFVYRNLGAISAFVGFGLILFSPALTLFAHSIWWGLYSYFIPMIALFLLFEKQERDPTPWTDKKILAILFGAMIVKYICTGFEFMPPTLIATMCPVIYYCIIKNRTLKESFFVLLKFGSVAVFGVLFSMLLLSIQIGLYSDSLIDGIEHILFSYRKRSTFEYSYMDGQGYDHILKYYLCEAQYALQVYIPMLKVRYLWIVILAFLSGVISYLASKKLGVLYQRKNIAILITTLFALLGPLSWIIIFKEHAATHINFDFIIWQIPFMPIASILIGRCVQTVVDALSKKSDKQIV